MSEPTWMAKWRRLAAERGYRETASGWLSPGGHRISVDFMRTLADAIDLEAEALSTPSEQHDERRVDT